MLRYGPRCLVALLMWGGINLCASAESLVEANRATVRFELVRENPSVNGERRQVMRYESDGLLQYALLLWPQGEQPATGWPVLLFNHGYHPDPPNYGRNASGESDRPGDYYRSVAQAYVDQGLVVLVPDYRGHNDSEGDAQSKSGEGQLLYSRDAVAAFRGLESLQGLDSKRRYVLGHSMGGPVTLAVLEHLREEIAAASIWSSMAVPEATGLLVDTGVPLLVQHARRDVTTSSSGSEVIANTLRKQGASVELVLYEGNDHLFLGDQFLEAVSRDLDWFARYAPP